MTFDFNIEVTKSPLIVGTYDRHLVDATVNNPMGIQANISMDRIVHVDNYVVTPPAHYNSTGVTGQYSFDDDYEYRCVSTNRWGRKSLTKNF